MVLRLLPLTRLGLNLLRHFRKQEPTVGRAKRVRACSGYLVRYYFLRHDSIKRFKKNANTPDNTVPPAPK